MKKRMLGNMEVSAIGLGCMGFSTGYGAVPEEKESIRLIRIAYEKGCTLFDTAEQYAVMRNEELVGKAIEPIRDHIVLVSKYAPIALPGQEIREGKLSREGVRYAVEGSLKRLRTDRIDLYYVHRVPDGVEIEELDLNAELNSAFKYEIFPDYTSYTLKIGEYQILWVL